MLDRRRAHRWEDHFEVDFRIGTQNFHAQVVNISWSGILLALGQNLAINDHLVDQEVNFRSGYEEGPFLKPWGRVVRFFETETDRNLAVKFVLDEAQE